MSGGLAVKIKKRGFGCGPERSDYTARVFCPKGLALTAWGSQTPADQNGFPGCGEIDDLVLSEPLGDKIRKSSHRAGWR